MFFIRNFDDLLKNIPVEACALLYFFSTVVQECSKGIFCLLIIIGVMQFILA